MSSPSHSTSSAASGPRHTIAGKLATIIAVFVAVIAVLFGIVYASFALTNGARAYVGGEGLWSKGQKDAVYYLTRYLDTRDADYYAKYRAAVSIPLGDHESLVALERPVPDMEAARQGFLKGQIPPDDIPYLTFLFLHFGDVRFLRQAISIWRVADRYVLDLDDLARGMHASIEDGSLTRAEALRLGERIEQINARLTPLESEFSEIVGSGARWLQRVVLQVVGISTLVLLGFGVWLTWRTARDVHAAIAQLREGAIRGAAGDLEHPITVRSNDELGELADVFNQMMVHRKATEHALEKERQFLEALLENLTEGIVACDEDGNLSVFNRATREMHGLSEEPLPPERWAEHYDLFQKDGKTRMSRDEVPLFRAFQGETIRDCEMVIAPKGRPRRSLSASGQAIATPSGRKLGAVVALHDITEYKRVTEELALRAEALAQSNAELEQFAYVASHDLKEPLRTVSSYAQLLERKLRPQADSDVQQYVNYITEGVHRMRDLIDGLLTFSRLSHDERSPETTRLNGIVDVALANLAAAIEESSAKVKVDPLPEALVRPGELVQVFQNLVGNALKFRSNRPLKIHIGASRHDGAWEIFVADNGIGIEPQHAEKVFGLFQRLHTRDVYPGAGLGLAICRKVIEGLGGSIRCRPGEIGTIFSFTLPAAQAHAA